MTGSWTSEEIYFDGDQYFDRMKRDIAEARELITVEMYIFNPDLLGLSMAEALVAAHKRGVKVQILVDGVGSYNFIGKLSRMLTEAGIQFKFFNPLPFLHPFYGQLSLYRKWQVFTSRTLRVNQRNHRKIVTIDQEILYTGSFNFTAEHTHLLGTKAWKDMGVRVKGPGVKYGVLNFKRHWKFRDFVRYKKQLKASPHNWRHSPLRLNHTLLMKRFFYKDFIHRIEKAQTKIWFTSPYFIPKRRVIRALGYAAKRGVDVRLLLSHKSDVWLFRTLQFFYYPYLIKAGVKIFQYSDTVLHAKNYIIDDWMTVGSTNLNHRSMLHDLEVDMVIQETENRRRIEEHFLAGSHNRPLITFEEMKMRPLKDRILSQLLFIFRYWF